MKVKYKNSGKILDLTKPLDFELEDNKGYLVLSNSKIYFFEGIRHEINCIMYKEVTNQFDILSKSDLLRLEAEQEENDLKALGKYTKVIREERVSRFEPYKKDLLRKGFDIFEYESQGKITIEGTQFGIVDYYPKANKILIRKHNIWVKPGLKWIKEHLL